MEAAPPGYLGAPPGTPGVEKGPDCQKTKVVKIQKWSKSQSVQKQKVAKNKMAKNKVVKNKKWSKTKSGQNIKVVKNKKWSKSKSGQK